MRGKQDNMRIHDDAFLTSPRLEFRLWKESDLDLATSLWGDPTVTRLIGFPNGFSDVQVRRRLAEEIATQEQFGVQYWPIFLLKSDELVGCCGLRPYNPDEDIMELGCHIRYGHWHRGYAFEASRAVMEHAFASNLAGSLFAGHHPENTPSRGLILKLGFRYTHDELYRPTGRRHPSYLITADQYFNRV